MIVAAPSYAAPVTFSASSGNLAASATFEVVAGKLQVTLRNTSPSDVMVPADVLTGVFFDIVGGGPTLTPDSAILGIGSIVVFGSTDPGNVVGGEWAYAASLAGAPNGATRGISSSGLGLFGNGNFPGSNLQGPTSTDGLQYGITSAGDNTATGNTPVTGTNALIKNSVVFTLTGIGGDFNPAAVIGNVSFQYGTSLSEPNIPEPATAGMAALGAACAFRRRRPRAAR
ncbi:MAG: PEP-CTERM sorting domain-containing protein [Planctomycetes bacterium]|nr:PEP-CTERM sorting domain-containing protein [Planctomycetota bacterium]